MVFAQKVLAPGPGIRPKATCRWCPFQSTLSGSLFFIPPALPEVMIIFASYPDGVTFIKPKLLSHSKGWEAND
jgi:hypothetical protein